MTLYGVIEVTKNLVLEELLNIYFSLYILNTPSISYLTTKGQIINIRPLDLTKL